MKNLLYLAAIAATAVGLTSCSSNEDLNDAVKDSGVPFKVTASAPTTRATDVTTDNFTNFKLYALEEGSTTPWINNVKFTKGTPWTPPEGTTCTWPTAGAKSTFYAVSENNSDGTFSGSMGDGAKTFTYTIPTNIADQKDLLVATTSGTSNDANVNLQFKHALAAAKLTFMINPAITTFTPTEEKNTTYRLYAKIQSITFNNVNTSGTYDFLGKNWNNIGTGSYTINFNPEIVIDTKTTATGSITVDLGTNGTIMFIPGAVNYWDIKPDGKPENLTNPTNAYMTIKAQTFDYDATGTTGLKTFLEKACLTAISQDYQAANGTGNWAYKDDNYYYSDAAKTKKIATSEAQILDFTDKAFGEDAAYDVTSDGITQLYTSAWQVYDVNEGDYPNLANTTKYGTLYKPLCNINVDNNNQITNTPLTFSSENIHNLKIDIAKAIRTSDGFGAFGTAADASGGAKRK
jgi:hypothetical protein